jgi:hypothetical protein
VGEKRSRGEFLAAAPMPHQRDIPDALSLVPHTEPLDGAEATEE